MNERIAFVFPGQGSQSVGMAADIAAASPAARRIFAIADHTTGFPLSHLCFHGPEETLRETINTQPAIVAASLATLAALQETLQQHPTPGDHDATAAEPALSAPLRPAYVAGHSVGEYAALAASGALSVAATLQLVRERGRLMHRDSLACPSGMAAVLGLDAPTLQTICADATAQAQAERATQTDATHPGADHVVIANDNAPGQIVISGAQRPLELASELARARGAKRVIPLTVSGAFHSPIMAPAAHSLAALVAEAHLRDPSIPLIANITAQPLTTAATLRAELAQQVESPVRWTQTIEYLADQGVTTYIEFGAGQVLAGLIKRIAKGATILSVATTADLAPIATRLTTQ